MIVPSSSRCSGPVALIGEVRGARLNGSDTADWRVSAALRAWIVEVDGIVVAPARTVARTTASATSSIEGLAPGRAALVGDGPPGPARFTSGRSVSGRRLRTMLLANRLSYSRRRRSAATESWLGPAIGSGLDGDGGAVG